MKIALFGASGAIGKILLADALAAGHDVRAVVRDPGKLGLTHAKLSVVRAELGDDAALAAAVRGSDAVISGLGLVKGADPAGVTAGVGRIVAAMDRERVSRFVAISGAGVLVDGDRRTLVGRVMHVAAKILYKQMVAQKEAEYAVIRASGVDWTLVRPTQLVDGAPRGKWRTSLASPPGPKISRADIAAFMLAAASDAQWSRKAPFVTW